MDTKHCMIVDLERRGNKRMFITEQVASINENKNGLWTVRFLSSSRVFNYNHSRLLYLTHPETIDINEKGLYVKTGILQMQVNCSALPTVGIRFIEWHTPMVIMKILMVMMYM